MGRLYEMSKCGEKLHIESGENGTEETTCWVRAFAEDAYLVSSTLRTISDLTSLRTHSKNPAL